MIFLQIKLWRSLIPHFYGIFTVESIYSIILMIQGHLRGQTVNFKVMQAEIWFLTSTARSMCNTSFPWDFYRHVYLWYQLSDLRSSLTLKALKYFRININIFALTVRGSTTDVRFWRLKSIPTLEWLRSISRSKMRIPNTNTKNCNTYFSYDCDWIIPFCV